MNKLIFILLAEVATSFVVFGQTEETNKTFVRSLLNEMHDAATWGLPTTNGIQMGVAMYLGNDSRFHKFGTTVYLYDTNFCGGLIYPPIGCRLEFSLQDANGHSMEKTEDGKSVSKPMGTIEKAVLLAKANMNMVARSSFLASNEVWKYESFYLLDCFKIERPGTNSLTVSGTIYKLKHGGGVYEVALSPVSMQVPITQADLDCYKASKQGAQ